MVPLLLPLLRSPVPLASAPRGVDAAKGEMGIAEKTLAKRKRNRRDGRSVRNCSVCCAATRVRRSTEPPCSSLRRVESVNYANFKSSDVTLILRTFFALPYFLRFQLRTHAYYQIAFHPFPCRARLIVLSVAHRA